MVVGRQASSVDLDHLFGALADATRRDILARVMDADASVSELAERYDMSFAAVQKHVAVLERARLVTKRKDGRAQRVAGNPDALRKVNRLLAQFEERWLGRVARLDALLATDDNAARVRPAAHKQGDPHARGRDSQGHQGPDHEGRRPVRRARRQGMGRVR
jgi:DNA-binding transcriptional ArsR family regulator